jgi:ribosomal protein L39E
MSRYIHPSKKKRLAKRGRQTRWAPFWSVLKVFGTNRRMHPYRITEVKRNWRRNKTKV